MSQPRNRERRVIATANAPQAIGPYSQAIACDGWLWCSGQIALDPATGTVIEGDVAVQAEQVMKNLTAVLEAAGCSFADVVKTTIFLSDMNDFATVNEVYGRYFDADRPARSTVQAGGLPKGVDVEIDCVARITD